MDAQSLWKNERAHRALPFWSWNDTLETGELCHQIDIMEQANNGGFFMHARGGLCTPYLGREWFSAIQASIDHAKAVGLEAWAYDENGWPSGFADGKVPKKGLAYQQKRIGTVVLESSSLPDEVMGLFKLSDEGYTATDRPEKGVLAVVMKVNRFYLDAFNPEAVDYFLEVTHEEYYRRFGEEFGKGLKGFFTDEPQFSSVRGCLPWSHIFEEEFSRRYGYSLKEKLPSLFFDYHDSMAVRYDYWRMVAELFRENFIRRMYDWCHAHHCQLTGHLMNDTDLGAQARAVADAMACYEYFDIPGIDWLGRNIGPAAAAKQVGSAAAQLGRPAISESFALCGWDVSPNDLRFIAGWQFVNGVSVICQHLEAYSLRGLRKRDYPAALFRQLPWYREAYADLNTYLSRLGALLTEGEEPAPLLVLQPMMSVSVLNNPTHYEDMGALSEKFNRLSEALNDAHLLHHYGNEVMMERMGHAEGAHIVIGRHRYDRVLIPEVTVISENTFHMLLEYAQNGGKLYAVSLPAYINGRKDDRVELLRPFCTPVSPENLTVLRTDADPSLCENGVQACGIHVAERQVGDEKLFYMINLTDRERTVTFATQGEYGFSALDLLSEKRTGIPSSQQDRKTTATLCFAPKEAKVLLADRQVFPTETSKTVNLSLNDTFVRTAADDNFLTLDFCEYAIDGGDWQPAKAVITLFRDLLSRRKACHVALRFSFTVADLPSRLCLLAETPQQHAFYINGKPFSFEDIGYAVDPAFRKADITSLVVTGRNEIVMETDFYQREAVYDTLFGKDVHETQRNKLTYDTELESIYLMGNFGVRSLDDFTYGERNSVFTGHRFELVRRPEVLSIHQITEQGHLFFAGSMTLTQKLSLHKEEGVRYRLKLRALHAACAVLSVNGVRVGSFVFSPFELDVTQYLHDGENELSLCLYSGNRNLLGPHHRPQGELYSVGPSTFTDTNGWTDDPTGDAWTDDYSFVRFGIEL